MIVAKPPRPFRRHVGRASERLCSTELHLSPERGSRSEGTGIHVLLEEPMIHSACQSGFDGRSRYTRLGILPLMANEAFRTDCTMVYIESPTRSRSHETPFGKSDKADDMDGISQTEIFTGHDR
jgi:hypothetical protein